MGLKSFPGGVHPHDYKEFSKKASIEQPPMPSKVIIPLSQHIGAPAKPVVKLKDQVKTGQLIAEGRRVCFYSHAFQYHGNGNENREISSSIRYNRNGD